METFQWITVPQSSFEYEISNRELCIEVRIYECYGELHAEPIYYKLINEQDKVLMDGTRRSHRESDPMWRYVELVVEGEYTPKHLDWMARWDDAFKELRRDRQVQDALDLDWFRSQRI